MYRVAYICDPVDYRTQIHTDTQNLVTYVTRATKGHRVALVTWITLCFFIIRNIGDRDTDTHRYTKLGHVCDPGDYRTQIHTDTQNWVTYVTRKTKGHRDTKLGHVCDLGNFNIIGHNCTRVTGSRWSRGSRCVFSLQKREHW